MDIVGIVGIKTENLVIDAIKNSLAQWDGTSPPASKYQPPQLPSYNPLLSSERQYLNT